MDDEYVFRVDEGGEVVGCANCCQDVPVRYESSEIIPFAWPGPCFLCQMCDALADGTSERRLPMALNLIRRDVGAFNGVKTVEDMR